MTSLPDSTKKVADAAERLGLAVEIVEMPDSTRTAEEAASACGCAVGQIVKSLVFAGAATGTPYLLLVSGSNRVDEKFMAGHLGEKLKRPDAAFVRDVTGFAIGGIPPFGHATPLRTLIDRDLLGYDSVWAAAGTPRSVFAVSPTALAEATAAEIVAVC
ncbi:MAG: YbaK/EbsC family protein [Hyphomicrobiales bacterium]|nr:YbaK/EbsC family protein [Hyphomicrobiales bacterium]